MGLSSSEVVSADNSLNWSQAGVLDNISKPVAAGAREPALKCPRCDSTNTKFCYYNNYSRMQPRHLCRACKRHWTAGGTLRTVPVGGGRRKNKRARTHDNITKTTNDDDVKLGGGPTIGQQLPFNLDYDCNIFPDVLSQVLSLPPTPLLLPSDNYNNIDSLSIALSSSQYKGQGLGLGREENSLVQLNKSIQELPELSLSYWNCWDGGLTEY